MKKETRVVSLGKAKVILLPDDRQSVTVKALVGAGSREESDREAGAAHFLEHFVFKGTKKYPGEFEVHSAIEKVGGAHNAYTSFDQVGFWTTMDREKLDLAVKIVGQLVSEPILSQKYFDKERGTILEELHMYEDLPPAKAEETMYGMVYGDSHMGRPIIGTVKSLKGMKLTDLSDYYTKWFVPQNMIVGVVGKWSDEKKLLAMIEDEFGAILRQDKDLPKRDAYVGVSGRREKLRIIKRKIEQANIAMGFAALPIGHKYRYALGLANLVLGGSTMSRLFLEVREKRGWAYTISSGIDAFSDSGVAAIGGGVPKQKVEDAVKLIKEIVFSLGEGKWQITEEDLAIAKETMKGRLSLRADDAEKLLDMAQNDLMFEGKIRTIEQIKQGINAVTLEDVKSVIKMVYREEEMSLAVVGDYDKLEGI